MTQYRVLDLFSGLGGWNRAFRGLGWDVTTLDIERKFVPDFACDILTVEDLSELEEGRGRFDVVLASPPCEAFSVASIGTHWGGGYRAYQPKTEKAKIGLSLVSHTFALIESYAPRFWIIENPRGVMRKIAPFPPTTTQWYCRWGETRAKPTDLWTNIPLPWPPPCRNGNPECNHERAPRGAKTTGTQGIRGAAARAEIPMKLSLAVARTCTREMRDA